MGRAESILKKSIPKNKVWDADELASNLSRLDMIASDVHDQIISLDLEDYFPKFIEARLILSGEASGEMYRARKELKKGS